MNSTTKKQLVAIVVLATLNVIVGLMTAGDGRDLAGRIVEAQSEEMRSALIKTLFFGIQLLSFGLGFLFALLPYKGKAYRDKVVPFSLTLAICVHVAFLLAGILKLL